MMNKRLVLGVGVILSLEMLIGLFIFDRVDQIKASYDRALEGYVKETTDILLDLLKVTAVKEGQLDLDRLRHFSEDRQQRTQSTLLELAASKSLGFDALIFDAQGVLVAGHPANNDPLDAVTPPELARALQGEQVSLLHDERIGSRINILTPIEVDHRILGVLALGKSSIPIAHLIHTTKTGVLMVGALLGVAIAILMLGLLFFYLQPIRLWAEYAKLYRHTNFPERTGLRRTRFGRFGAAIDHMFDALAGRKLVEAYVQSLVHEIKNPLAIIVSDAEFLQEPLPEAKHQEFVQSIEKQSRRILDIVERLLVLARMERIDRLRERVSIDVRELVEGVLNEISPLMINKAINISLHIPADLTMMGESFLLGHAVRNLLVNAYEHSPPGKTIEVRVIEDAGNIVFTVRDHGQGIPYYALKRVFEKFYSLPLTQHASKRSGLGLNMVLEVAELHGGSATIENHSKGGAIATMKVSKA